MLLNIHLNALMYVMAGAARWIIISSNYINQYII